MIYNILVVDDDIINRKLLTYILSKQSSITASICEAQNGREALEILKVNQNINLILLDIVMPVLDGIGFLELYKKQNISSMVRIIVLSTDDSQKSKVLSLGANDFLQKPINESRLLESLKRLN